MKGEPVKTTKARRFIDVATTCVLGLSLLLLMACVVVTLVSRDNPDGTYLLGIKPIYVSTTAMEPAIQQNSIVFFRKIALDEINEGDIVLRTYNDSTVIRRVVKKTSGGECITKADNRFFEDATTLDSSNFIAILLFR